MSTPATTRDWCELALAELRLAPHPAHLQAVADWLARHPVAPRCTRVQLATAMARLQEEESDQPDLFGEEVQP